MPETTAYLYLGLVAIAVIMLVLIGSMALRYRGLQQDLKTLEQLDSDK
ncbi:MAG: hypothetical protein IPO91_25895 [Chloroflexi bacterium]|nr:hypothetical protein [Chloroflexota bacterium]